MIRAIFLIFLVLSSNANSCLVGPVQIGISEELGLAEKYRFKHTEKLSEFCDNCLEISINAPKVYKNKDYSHGVLTVSFHGRIASKSTHSVTSKAGNPEFLGYASNKPGYRYEVSFLYGKGICQAYEFKLQNKQS